MITAMTKDIIKYWGKIHAYLKSTVYSQNILFWVLILSINCVQLDWITLAGIPQWHAWHSMEHARHSPDNINFMGDCGMWLRV